MLETIKGFDNPEHLRLLEMEDSFIKSIVNLYVADMSRIKILSPFTVEGNDVWTEVANTAIYSNEIYKILPPPLTATKIIEKYKAIESSRFDKAADWEVLYWKLHDDVLLLALQEEVTS